MSVKSQWRKTEKGFKRYCKKRGYEVIRSNILAEYLINRPHAAQWLLENPRKGEQTIMELKRIRRALDPIMKRRLVSAFQRMEIVENQYTGAYMFKGLPDYFVYPSFKRILCQLRERLKIGFFVEIKSGEPKLSRDQRRVKLILEKRGFKVYIHSPKGWMLIL